jgi:hypothetical protein
MKSTKRKSTCTIVDVQAYQRNDWRQSLHAILESIFGIRQLQRKLRSTVWTVHYSHKKEGGGSWLAMMELYVPFVQLFFHALYAYGYQTHCSRNFWILLNAAD